MGTVVFSLDVELGWGLWHIDPFPTDRVTAARAGWSWLADLFDRLEVPVTWAIVGHLFLSECDRDHREHPAGRRCCTTGGPTRTRTPWFAHELVERVVSSSVDHDVGAHGFTHITFDHEVRDRSAIRRELAGVEAATRARDLTTRSFVYPRNRVEYRALLSEYDFTCYRGIQPTRLGGIRKLIAATTNRWTPPLVEPSIDGHGLVDVPASMYLFSLEGRIGTLVDRIHGDPVVNAARRGLEALRGTDRILHLWFHPNNLTSPTDRTRIRRIVQYAARLQAQGAVTIETMDSVADRTLATRGMVR